MQSACSCSSPANDSLFALHEYPCNLHNHVHPRGLCKGRCQDCGGCNMGVDCTHFNASGGPIHPDPENKMSIPPCTRVSEDKTRCYRRRDGDLYVAIEEDFGQGDDMPPSNTASVLMVNDEPKEGGKNPKTQKKKRRRNDRKGKKVNENLFTRKPVYSAGYPHQFPHRPVWYA